MSSHTSSHEPSEHAASGNADARPGQAPGAGQAAAGRTSILPSAGAVIQSGAFGAALSGVTTAIADAVRVQAGEITKQEAAKDVARASLQGALTMAVASSVGHMVRARPVIGLAILAVAGVGALMMMGERKRQPRRVAPPLPQPQAPAP
ncbi:MAG: hypothetical protein LDL44_17310, partial [Caenispirillum sp.]|nr:hypothetical protein [Caenispirillum sp.]